MAAETSARSAVAAETSARALSIRGREVPAWQVALSEAVRHSRHSGTVLQNAESRGGECLCVKRIDARVAPSSVHTFCARSAPPPLHSCARSAPHPLPPHARVARLASCKHIYAFNFTYAIQKIMVDGRHHRRALRARCATRRCATHHCQPMHCRLFPSGPRVGPSQRGDRRQGRLADCADTQCARQLVE